MTGVTLSREQLKISRERAAREGRSRAVRFEFEDYRKVEGSFDRIVSVGMFEHVGVNHYGAYFRKLRELLTDDGVALIHTIGRSEPPTATSPFIAKYIFPGGYIPALSEMSAAIERSGLIIADLEVLRLHYAETLRAWRQRFLANWDKAAAIQDETFCRMWEFYLAASEDRVPLPEPRRVPGPAGQAHQGPADHARLHVQGRAHDPRARRRGAPPHGRRVTRRGRPPASKASPSNATRGRMERHGISSPIGNAQCGANWRAKSDGVPGGGVSRGWPDHAPPGA